MYFLDTVASREAASSNVSVHDETTVSDPSSPHQRRNTHGKFDLLECKSALLVLFESDIQYHYFYSTSENFMMCNYFYSTSGIN